jgi:hypothetical protein
MVTAARLFLGSLSTKWAYCLATVLVGTLSLLSARPVMAESSASSAIVVIPGDICRCVNYYLSRPEDPAARKQYTKFTNCRNMTGSMRTACLGQIDAAATVQMDVVVSSAEDQANQWNCDRSNPSSEETSQTACPVQ